MLLDKANCPHAIFGGGGALPYSMLTLRTGRGSWSSLCQQWVGFGQTLGLPSGACQAGCRLLSGDSDDQRKWQVDRKSGVRTTRGPRPRQELC